MNALFASLVAKILRLAAFGHGTLNLEGCIAHVICICRLQLRRVRPVQPYLQACLVRGVGSSSVQGSRATADCQVGRSTPTCHYLLALQHSRSWAQFIHCLMRGVMEPLLDLRTHRQDLQHQQLRDDCRKCFCALHSPLSQSSSVEVTVKAVWVLVHSKLDQIHASATAHRSV